MTDYYVSFGIGAGDFIENSLDNAKKRADIDARYTANSIRIFELVENETKPDFDSEFLAIRRWWGVPFDADVYDDTDIIDFGDFGYYGDWE